MSMPPKPKEKDYVMVPTYDIGGAIDWLLNTGNIVAYQAKLALKDLLSENNNSLRERNK